VYLGHDFYGYASQDPGGGDIGPTESKPFVSAVSDSEVSSSSKRKRNAASDQIERDAQQHPSQFVTIESLIFGALTKSCFIESRAVSGYTRCGRTDRGVSAGGQVLSIRLRSKALRRDPLPGSGISKESPAYRCSSAINDIGVTGFSPEVTDGGKKPDGGKVSFPVEENDFDESRVWSRGDGLANTGDPFPHPSQEHDYALALNNILPPEIRVLGWVDAPDDFSARFSATLRTYRYYFPCRGLDLKAMREAGQRLCQRADFRNICKIDLAATQNFVREILSVRIVSADASYPQSGNVGGPLRCTSFSPASQTLFSPEARKITGDADEECLHSAFRTSGGRTMVYLEVVGRAFLWHQIRCIAALLFLVGRGLETPDSVAALLDISKVSARPVYHMAPEAPLVLQNCGFGEELESMGGANCGVLEESDTPDDRPGRFLRSYPPASPGSSEFYASPAALCKVSSELEAQWSALTVKASIIRGMQERVNALLVSGKAVEASLGLTGDSVGIDGSNRLPETLSWGEVLQNYGGVSGPLLSFEDLEYPIQLRMQRNCKGAGVSPIDRGYVPLLSRTQGASVEERWRNLTDEERREITIKHPLNAPRLQEHCQATAIAPVQPPTSMESKQS